MGISRRWVSDACSGGTQPLTRVVISATAAARCRLRTVFGIAQGMAHNEQVIAPATVIVVFHPGVGPGFDDWLGELAESARRAPGCISVRQSLYPASGTEPALAVSFSSEGALTGWLDGAERAQIVEHGAAHGFRSSAADIVVNGAAAPTGVVLFRHSVADPDEFLSAQADLVQVCRGFPGFIGIALFAEDGSEEWMSVLRFRTDRELADWLASDARRSALVGLRSSLTTDFVSSAQTTAFATTVRSTDGRIAMTPGWKTAMVVLMVLYPTVMLLSRFLGPILAEFGARPWLAIWLSQVVSIVAMQWWLMPAASRWFRRWLDPVDGAGWRVGVRGAALVAGVYAVTLAVFASVHWLQFWDYLG